MAIKLGRQRLIVVSLETTKGTPVDGATHTLVFDPVLNPDDTNEERPFSGSSQGTHRSSPGPRTGTASFRAELRSDGAGALDGGISILLQGCGRKLTAGAYSPVTAVADQKTVTIDLHEGGIRRRIYGAMGSVTIEAEAGRRVMLSFEFSGVWAAPQQVTAPTPTINNRLPMRLANATFMVGEYSPMIGQLSLNLNNTVEPREDIHVEGVGHYYVGDRGPTLDFDPESPDLGDHDAYAAWLDGTEAAAEIVLADATTVVTISAPKAQYKAPQQGDRGAKAVLQLSAQLNNDAGDDDLLISVAAAEPEE